MTILELGEAALGMAILELEECLSSAAEAAMFWGANGTAESAPLIRIFVATLTPDPVWQKRFYDFNVWSERKRIEKLRYMHHNPGPRQAWSSLVGVEAGEACAGRATGAMTVEQLPFLLLR